MPLRIRLFLAIFASMAMKDTIDPSRKSNPSSSSAAFKVGAIALAFLVIGYQTALFVGRAARLRIEAHRDRPDTVYISGPGPGASSPTGTAPTLPGQDTWSGHAGGGVAPDPVQVPGMSVRRNAPHSEFVQNYRRATRRVESFRFNPNTVSVEDLIRLGFSEKQARAIDNYRAKGGRFRRKSDFAKSFVVADSVYRRLERYIDIPRLNLNTADSTALDALPGIGPYFATKILSYRRELGGYSYPEQLMDLYHFDQEKYDALSDLVYCSRPEPFALWTLPADSLRLHPYIRSREAARSIILFREHTPREGWTVDALAAAGILPAEQASKLARCVIAEP